MRRSLIVYFFAWLVMTVYGGEVCPFLESLSIQEWGGTLAVAFVLMYGLRAVLRRRWGIPADPSEVDEYNGMTQFTVEFVPFVVMGIAVALFDRLYYGFPFLDSGLAAVVVGAVLLGIFTAVDLSLESERRLILSLKERNRSLSRNREFYPLTRKFAVLASVLMLAMMTVILMVLSHDLTDSMSFQRVFETRSARITMMLEMAFIVATFLVIVLDLIFTYARNLKLLFENEIRALRAADGGSLTGHVPVVTNDEFGVIADYTNRMISSLKNRTEELQRTQDVTIHSLASLAETRDNETGAHLIRTQRYVCVLAGELRETWGLSDHDIDLLYKSAPLHDIGKVGIPDRILLKPGPLSEEEWREMKRHAEYGAQALAQAEARLGTSSFLSLAREIAAAHHERWDGSGYPRGLSGEDIPRSGRIMALADVYDALISRRTYKDAFSHANAREIIVSERGTHFDPDVVDSFISREGKFRAIAEEVTDSAATVPFA